MISHPIQNSPGVCTAMACPDSNPCCNSCGSSPKFGNIHLVQSSSDILLGCYGNNCDYQDNCVYKNGDKVLVYGTVDSFGWTIVVDEHCIDPFFIVEDNNENLLDESEDNVEDSEDELCKDLKDEYMIPGTMWCEMYLGVAVWNGKCTHISGCSAGDNSFFTSIDTCNVACGLEELEEKPTYSQKYAGRELELMDEKQVDGYQRLISRQTKISGPQGRALVTNQELIIEEPIRYLEVDFEMDWASDEDPSWFFQHMNSARGKDVIKEGMNDIMVPVEKVGDLVMKEDEPEVEEEVRCKELSGEYMIPGTIYCTQMLGIGVWNGDCKYISGCSANDNTFFSTMEECYSTCFPTTDNEDDMEMEDDSSDDQDIEPVIAIIHPGNDTISEPNHMPYEGIKVCLQNTLSKDIYLPGCSVFTLHQEGNLTESYTQRQCFWEGNAVSLPPNQEYCSEYELFFRSAGDYTISASYCTQLDSKDDDESPVFEQDCLDSNTVETDVVNVVCPEMVDCMPFTDENLVQVCSLRRDVFMDECPNTMILM